MKKKVFLVVMIFCLLSSMFVFAETPIKVFVNQNEVAFDVEPQIINGRTLVPLRAIFEELGTTVEWIAETRTVISKKDNISITLQIDSDIAKINDKEIKLDVPAMIINGRTLVPLRFVGESFGLNVGWNGDLRQVTLNTKILYNVTKVVDGDTIDVDIDGRIERVRFTGIDTPETVHPTKEVQSYGVEASNFTKEQLLNKDIELEFDVQERDMYGRLLAYIWLDGVMFNNKLLEEGFAKVSTFPPNVKYVDLFLETQRQAQENNKGLWGLSEYKEQYEQENAKVNVNTASKEELIKIIHIDDIRADDLISKRPFTSLDDLDKIKGIGSARVKDIKEQGLAVIE